jgi:cation:H+ antiporter
MTPLGESVLVGVFIASIVVMSWASVRFTAALERLGARAGFTEGLLGLVAALGADAPEICSAVIALLSGHHEVGLGVVLGSNIFNLAGLLGLSALVAGRVAIGRQGLWLNGGTSLLVSGVLLALLLGALSARASLGLLALVLVPYGVLTALHPRQIARLALPRGIARYLQTAVAHGHLHAAKGRTRRSASRRDFLWLALSLAAIVGASIGAVRCALSLSAQWGVSASVVGSLVLAALTSLPNVITGVQLARDGRGAAVVSESLNSNTLNVLVGVCLPALVIGIGVASPAIVFAAFWLLGMKLVALVAASHRNGLHRAGGALLVLLYAAFAVFVVQSH